MSLLTIPGTRSMQLFSGRAHPALATAVASELGITLSPLSISDFASGETSVRLEDSVRGCEAYVLQSHPAPVNSHLMETLLIVDALKRAGCNRVTVVIPFFPYARQDKKGNLREPIAASLVTTLLQASGADRLMSVDLHTEQIQGFFPGPLDHVHAMGILSDYVESRFGGPDLTIVSPDAGRVKVAEKWTDRLNAPMAIIHKRRDPRVPNEARVMELVGEVEGRTCVLVDDMIDTGGTIVKAAETLSARGAARVLVVATHGVLSDPARARLAASPIDEVVLTDSLPVAPGPKLTILPLAPVLAKAIAASFAGSSVTELFDGQA